MDIALKNCHYCDTPPSNKAAHSRGVTIVRVSGVDRIDNTKGYIIDNCVPCCKDCNRAKSDLTMEEFKSWIKRLLEKFNVNI